MYHVGFVPLDRCGCSANSSQIILIHSSTPCSRRRERPPAVSGVASPFIPVSLSVGSLRCEQEPRCEQGTVGCRSRL